MTNDDRLSEAVNQMKAGVEGYHAQFSGSATAKRYVYDPIVNAISVLAEEVKALKEKGD